MKGRSCCICSTNRFGRSRQRVRPEHKAYLAQVADRIAFAGPLLHDDGDTMLGSLLVIDFASRDALQAWLPTTLHAPPG